MTKVIKIGKIKVIFFIGEIMKICGIQKVSLVDYNEHISTTIFTSGCNFSCPFCHNAGLVKGNEPEIPEKEILNYLTKRKSVLDAVVISGGEPTLHKDLPIFISKIKELGYLIKLDTNGTNIEMLKYLIDNKLIDYVAMDIKNSLDKYNLTIGKDYNFNHKEVIEYIMTCGIDYEFRTTLIDGHHSESDVIKIGKLIKGAKRYYLQKFEDSGNCLSSGLKEVDYNTALRYQNILKDYIPNTFLRGY